MSDEPHPGLDQVGPCMAKMGQKLYPAIAQKWCYSRIPEIPNEHDEVQVLLIKNVSSSAKTCTGFRMI